MKGFVYSATMLYYFFQACFRYRVSPIHFFNLQGKHIAKGYTSKYELNGYVPQKNRLRCILLKHTDTVAQHTKLITTHFTFPVILKPEGGFLAHGVKKIQNKTQLRHFLHVIQGAGVDYICQAFYPYEQEYDIFYVRNKRTTRILSITQVTLPTVYGDGVHTLRWLIRQLDIKHKPTIHKLNQDELDTILPEGKEHTLSYKNSYLLGTAYTDRKDLLRKNLSAIKTVINTIQEFKLNRLSVRAKSERDLLAGNFKIFEMNILFPAPLSSFDETLPMQERRTIMKTTIANIFALIKEQRPRITLRKFLHLAPKHYYHEYKVVKIGKKC
ncbi:MAG: hypothetical protein OXR66_01655 [Candidatus Woesearchaeota archaeon]|nr:hypothetical protein [Candidatus Woesearchaeota archaeon]